MQILILGSNGQVATQLKKQLSSVQNQLVSYSSAEMNFLDDSSIISGLENHEKTTRSNNEPKIIINAAAYTNVELAESEEEKAFKINANAPRLIAKFAKENGYLFVHYSTDYVFNGEKEGEYEETDKTNPINKYGLSKLAGENNIISTGGNYLILRTSWVFSETGVNFVKKMAELLLKQKELKIISDQKGRPTYAGFIAKTTSELINHYEDHAVSEITNVCQAKTASWYEMAVEVKKALLENGLSTSNILPIPSTEYNSKARRPKNSVLSLQKLKHILPEYKITNWKDEIPEIVNKLLENEFKFS